MATDANTSQLNDFVFPSWINKIIILGLACGGLFGGYAATVGFFATHPKVINVGHMPEQPIPFSHALHAGKLKLDCRYCHNTVEKAAHAAIPPSATCGNCHGGKDRVKPGATLAAVHLKSEKLAPLRESLETDTPVNWLRVHELPGFVYFNHSAHVTRGVSCVECHGRIDKMEVVYQAKELSMKWCLDCHRNPDEAIRPFDQVTNLGWNPDKEELKTIYMEELEKAFEKLAPQVSVDANPVPSERKSERRLFFYPDGEDRPEFTASKWRDTKTHQDNFAKLIFGDPKLADENSDNEISLQEAVAFLDTKTDYTRKDLGQLLRATHKINPNQSCSTCHR
ncbi:MAG: cytochrome c3 family protein [Pirellulaceae bacterium]|nr:cytochrome c3 family protein [Pirellulaceae bacterium]